MARRSFAILHQDDHLLSVTKPSGMLVNMAERNEETLQDQIRSVFRDPSIVALHRLDRYTSGVVLFALSDQARKVFPPMFESAAIEKTYWALVVGAPDSDEGVIRAGIERVQDRRRKVAISTAKHAWAAETRWRVLERLAGVTLIECKIPTGRTHQIRVHLEHLGCPVAGDAIYGDKKANHELRQTHRLFRQFLHARNVALTHPITGKELRFEAKMQKDLSGPLKSLRAISETQKTD